MHHTARRTSFRLFALLATLLGGLSSLSAQTAISNLGQSVGGTATVGTYSGGGESWRRAFAFTTGASAGGYDFTAFRMNWLGATGSPGALTVGLYSSFDPNSVAGGSGLLATLSLTSGDPLVSGNTVFSGTATLQASSTYFVQISSASAPMGNYYSYSVVGTGNEDGGGLPGWSIANAAFESNYNNLWTSNSGPGLIAIDATAAIPEPSTYAALAGVMALGLAVWRRRKAAVVTA